MTDNTLTTQKATIIVYNDKSELVVFYHNPKRAKAKTPAEGKVFLFIPWQYRVNSIVLF